MKSPKTLNSKNEKSSGSLGIWLVVAISLSFLTLFLLLRSPEPKLNLSEPIPPVGSASGSQSSETEDDQIVYRPVERDGGRSVAVPKQSLPHRLDTEASKVNSESELTAMSRISDLIDEGRWPEAEELLIELLSENPKDERALFEMAMLQLIERKDPFVARDFLERALIVNPDNETAINELLVVYQETNNLEGGLSFLRSLSEGGVPRESGALESGIGNALLQSGRAEESLQYFQQALELSSVDDPYLREQLGSAYVEAGRFDEGVDMLRSVMAQEADPFRLKNMQIKLAAAYINRQDKDEALRILYDAQNLHPEDELIARIITDLTTGRL